MTTPPPREPPPRRVLIYRGIGLIALGLAAIGVALPVMPTTVFLLIAVWAFARGSPEWAERLRQHPTYGEFIRNWEERGAIPTRAKILAVTMMTASVGVVALATRNAWIVGGVAIVLACVSAYVVSRPAA
ncbi:YbaN family protein [Phenylobacterium sp. VNQ135]|uniref:YbaN family protein n=1 Tax=Phenylobacterium sp. VNQ135 TaxID=3400922 RepID=UPI003C0F3D6E